MAHLLFSKGLAKMGERCGLNAARLYRHSPYKTSQTFCAKLPHPNFPLQGGESTIPLLHIECRALLPFSLEGERVMKAAPCRLH
jgi:hypothetical protein